MEIKTWVLVGPPAAGKTTVGQLLAAGLDTQFYDSDQEIIRRAAKPISAIFAELGQSEFRRIELEVIGDLLTKPGVLALGGGAVTNRAVRDLLSDQIVFWLQVDSLEATKRVGDNKDRPLLAGDVKANLDILINQRQPFYEQVATHQIPTGQRSPQQITESIIQLIKSRY